LVAIADEDAGALGDKAADDGGADARGSAGDEGDFVLKTGVHDEDEPRPKNS
jgi:hypothetical protein